MHDTPAADRRTERAPAVLLPELATPVRLFGTVTRVEVGGQVCMGVIVAGVMHAA